jgi:hypothetical protein
MMGVAWRVGSELASRETEMQAAAGQRAQVVAAHSSNGRTADSVEVEQRHFLRPSHIPGRRGPSAHTGSSLSGPRNLEAELNEGRSWVRVFSPPDVIAQARRLGPHPHKRAIFSGGLLLLPGEQNRRAAVLYGVQ